MDKFTGNMLQKVKLFFERYESNQPVIFSIFEDQFEGCAYVDDASDIHWVVLQTPFLQHFIAGKPTAGCETALEHILFDLILQEQDEKEIVAFADSDRWDGILNKIYAGRNGVFGTRKIFEFSKENYGGIVRPRLPEGVQVFEEKCKCLPFSKKDTWSAKLILSDKIVSYCNAIMVARGMAEIDIHTDEDFRGRGYAAAVAVLLIDKLLEDGLVPVWSAWPFRTASQRIALKLGFIPKPDAKAWIWQEGM